MKILIRLPNWLGDVVMATAFVNAVKVEYRDACIDVVIKKELTGIAELIPGINKVYSFSKHDHPGLKGVYLFGKALKPKRYDIYFNLPHSLSSFVMAWASRAKQRIGFRKEGGIFLLTKSVKKPVGLHRADEYLHLLEAVTNKPVLQRKVELKAAASKDTSHKVVINFNSEASSRRMPVDKGRSIINALTAHFTDLNFVFVGSPKEAPFIDELLKGTNNPNRLHNQAGKTNLKGLAELMAGAKAILTTDSGPAHLANAVGTPTIVLFGAGDERNTAPYHKTNLQIIRYGELPCEPCVRNTCKLYGIPKCMEMLDEKKIIKALSLYLNYA